MNIEATQVSTEQFSLLKSSNLDYKPPLKKKTSENIMDHLQ